jgi:hypothetical protein
VNHPGLRNFPDMAIALQQRQTDRWLRFGAKEGVNNSIFVIPSASA